MNREMNTVVLKHVLETEDSELDFVLQDEYGGVDVVVEAKGKWSGEGQVISIERFRELVEQGVKKGATHMEIMHHKDHQGYVLNFYKDFHAE